MKQKFSTHWKRSKQTRKQRKFRANAPIHIKREFISSHLSKDLRKKYGKRSFALRKGDEVKIMRGKYKKKTGKISAVDIKMKKVAIEGIQGKKRDGTKVNIFFDASNLMINELNLDDKKRLEALMRKIPLKAEKAKSEEKKPEKKNIQPKTEKSKKQGEKNASDKA